VASSSNLSLLADVLALPGRSGGVHATGGLGEGAGREPGRQHPRALVYAAAALCQLCRANAWLEARCLAEARASAHPEQTDKTVWEVFEAEQASLIPYPGPFDGFHEVEVAVSKNETRSTPPGSPCEPSSANPQLAHDLADRFPVHPKRPPDPTNRLHSHHPGHAPQLNQREHSMIRQVMVTPAAAK
jgi:hypothetical protein